MFDTIFYSVRTQGDVTKALIKSWIVVTALISAIPFSIRNCLVFAVDRHTQMKLKCKAITFWEVKWLVCKGL